MKNYKAVLEYDGSNFSGFQRQPGKITIQQVFEEALSRLFNQKLKITAASGRTDAGVHALSQIVNFKVQTHLVSWKIVRGLNYYLPEGVAVKKIVQVPLDFHARFHAKSKIYEYWVWNHSVRSPLLASRSFHFPFALNIAVMKTAARKFTGKRDFSAVAALSGMRKKRSGHWVKGSAVRTIRSLRISGKSNGLLKFRVEADGFLHHMVRNVVGTLLDIGSGKIPAGDVERILESGDRSLAGRNLPPQGLTLVSVKY